jgi:murein DD-endopeptidase MepM/ murein hydrolase activator NlpD
MSKINPYRLWLILGAIPLVVLTVLLTVINSSSEDEDFMADLVDEITEIQFEFGLPVDSFIIHKGTIEQNQFLADILLRHKVSYPEIHKLVENSKSVFDIRHFQPGKNYTVFCSKDSLEKATCFVYQPNDIEYIVFEIGDTMRAYRGEKEVETRVREASGVISSSLYMTMKENGLSDALVMRMADMYAWTIDFYRIQKGDYFRIIFEEKFVEDEFIGIGKILAAKFVHSGRDYFGFLFNQGEKDDYFDEEGQGLRKAFLKAPLKFGRISSHYNPKRLHPVQKVVKPHYGTDYAAPTGTPILTVGDGTVIEAKFTKNNGNYVKVKHNSTYTTQYLHMSKFASGIKPGARVKQGEVIGYVGSTGLATGPHVCFRFWKNGQQVNHLKEDFPTAEPISDKNREAFEEYKSEMISRLEQIEV